MILLLDIQESQYHYQPSWVMVIVVLSVMILGYLFSAYNSKLVSVVKAFFATRFIEQLSREEHSLSHPASVFLSLNFLVTSSLFILQATSSSPRFSFLEFSFLSFLLIAVLVFTTYFIKILSLKILGFIFAERQTVNEYVFIIFIVNQVIGIGFIPVIIFMAYGQPALANASVYLGILLFILAFIIRTGKGAIAFLGEGRISPVYLFLYLCTLEILPLLLGLKLIEKWS